jgi:hypothetical protein
MAIELRYGKFGPYFHDDGDDLGLGEVLILLGNGDHLRREVESVLQFMEYEVVPQADCVSEYERARKRLRDAIDFQTELVQLRYDQPELSTERQ